MSNLETQSAYNIENKDSVSDISNKDKEFLDTLDKNDNVAEKLANDLKSDISFHTKIDLIKNKESTGKLPSIDTLSNQYDVLDKKVVEGATIIDNSEYTSKDIVSKMLDTATKTGYTDLKITNVITDTKGVVLSVGSSGKKTSEKGVSEDAGVNFYRASNSPEFSSKETILVNEYYESGTVVWADDPIKYNQ